MMLFHRFSRLRLTNLQKPLVHRCGLYPAHNLYSTTSKDENTPIKYSTSDAAKWQAKFTRLGEEKNARLWYEPYVILASVSIFLIYFTILREENEIDAGLESSLFTRFPGFEEQQLKQLLEYNIAHNLDTSQVRTRLKELESEHQT